MDDQTSAITVLRTVGTAVTVSRGVYSILKELGIFDRLKELLTGDEGLHILLLGASGVGKTAFLQVLQGQEGRVDPDDRTIEPVHIAGKMGKLRVTFADTAGHKAYEALTAVAIREAMTKERLGIVNVVSYGYHEGRDRPRGLSDPNKLHAYLEARRAVEIEALSRWVTLLTGLGGAASWMLTVVNKADLWWAPVAQSSILEYYERGPYSDALGRNCVRHAVVPHSAVGAMFCEEVPMSGYYTDAKRDEDRASFLRHLLDLAGR